MKRTLTSMLCCQKFGYRRAIALAGLLFFVFFSSGVQAESYSGYAPFPAVGQRAVRLAWQKLDECGLIRMSAFDPRLPAPLVPAQEAIVSPQGQLLAYYMEDYSAGFGAEFKNPDGSFSHSVGFTNGRIRFVTPLEGVIAQGNTFAMVGAVGTNLYCRSFLVAPNQFLNCIEAFWVNRIVGELCPYGE